MLLSLYHVMTWKARYINLYVVGKLYSGNTFIATQMPAVNSTFYSSQLQFMLWLVLDTRLANAQQLSTKVYKMLLYLHLF